MGSTVILSLDTDHLVEVRGWAGHKVNVGVEDVSLVEDALVGGVGVDEAVTMEVQLASLIPTLVCTVFDVKCLDTEHLRSSSHCHICLLDEGIASRTLSSSS